MNLAGSLCDKHERGVTVVAFDVELFGVAVATVNAHGFECDLLAHLGGEELRHASFQVAALTAVFLTRRVLEQEPGRLDSGCHIRQLDLDGLMLCDGFAEGLTLLRIANGIIKGGLRYPDGTCGHINAPDFQAAHGMPKTLAFFAAKQPCGRNTHVVEDQFRRLDPLVAQLFKGAADAQTWRAFFDDENAHAAIGRIRVCIGAR